jgi:hypothetical protein
MNRQQRRLEQKQTKKFIKVMSGIMANNQKLKKVLKTIKGKYLKIHNVHSF